MDKWMGDSQLNLRACVMTIQTRDYPSCYHGEEFRTRGPAGTPREDTRSPRGSGLSNRRETLLGVHPGVNLHLAVAHLLDPVGVQGALQDH